MSNRHLVATIDWHPGEEISLGVNMVNTSASTPTSPTTTVYSITETTSTNVTSSVGAPSASVSSTTVYTGTIMSLTDGTKYQAELSFTLDGNVLVEYWIINCSDNRPPAA